MILLESVYSLPSYFLQFAAVAIVCSLFFVPPVLHWEEGSTVRDEGRLQRADNVVLETNFYLELSWVAESADRLMWKDLLFMFDSLGLLGDEYKTTYFTSYASLYIHSVLKMLS